MAELLKASCVLKTAWIGSSECMRVEFQEKVEKSEIKIGKDKETRSELDIMEFGRWRLKDRKESDEGIRVGGSLRTITIIVVDKQYRLGFVVFDVMLLKIVPLLCFWK